MGSVKGYLFLKKRMGLALVAFCSIICVNHGILIMNYVMIKWWVSGIQGQCCIYLHGGPMYWQQSLAERC